MKQYHRFRLLAGMLTVLMLTGLLSIGAAAKEQVEPEDLVVWVAGNPDLYPLEYYNPVKRDFDGAIPDVLRDVARHNGLELRYRDPGFADKREQLVAEGKVQLVSGLLENEGDDWAGVSGRSNVLTNLTGVENYQGVAVGWVEGIDPEVVEQLQEGLAHVSRDEMSILLLSHVRDHHISRMEVAIGAILLVALTLLIIVAYQLVHHRRMSARQHKLLTDPATGLGSLTYFKRACQQQIKSDNRSQYCMIYFGADVDRMRVFHGPDGATEMMVRLGDLLQEHCGEHDVLTRFGASCFAMARLTEGRGENERWLRHFFRHIWDAYSDPNTPNVLRFHAGIYYLDEVDEQTEDHTAALFRARQGYLHAVKYGLDYAETDAYEVQAADCREQNLRDSQEALDGEQFKIFLQPMVNTHSGRVVGAEALARWEHPTRGLLGPDQFIDMMVREGMIFKLDYYMMEHVCRLLEQLDQQGLGDIFITCNFSPATLDEPDVLDRVRAMVEKYHFNRKKLVVEVTEEVVSRNPDTYQRNLESLREMGLSTSLDDFGSGYTSFHELSTHSFNILKIDQSLLRNMDLPYGREVLSGLVDFTRRLNLVVLCEGVEELDQAELLADMGCDLLQGFYFSKPIPAEKVMHAFQTSRENPVMGEGAVPFSSLL